MTRHERIVVLSALLASACGDGPGPGTTLSSATIPPGTPLSDIEALLSEQGGSYLVAQSEACGSDGNAAPAVIAVMDRGRGLMSRSNEATTIICLDAQRRATRIVYDGLE